MLQQNEQASRIPAELMLPAYIQHGVRTPEAAVASLFGVPRLFAESAGSVYRKEHGDLAPARVPAFRAYLESADTKLWGRVVEGSALAGKVAPEDVRLVWRRMRGLG